MHTVVGQKNEQIPELNVSDTRVYQLGDNKELVKNMAFMSKQVYNDRKIQECKWRQ